MVRTSRLGLWPALALAAGILSTNSLQALPAFPGAEGFGAIATGGRGGRVIKVTTLAATGPGSLQEALDETGPRIIVFEVSGVIDGDITVNEGDVTIGGQTAPGAGITIQGRFFGRYDTSVNNIIVRFIRVRPEFNGGAGEQFDAVQFSRNSELIFDHISVSWGVDETVDIYSASDVTIQYSTIAESATSGHPEGEHNYGLINGPDGQRVAVHHNLFVHHKNRNPALANGPAEVRNNVIYNARHGFIHHNPPSGPFNIVGNYYASGDDDDLIPFYFDDDGEGAGPGLAYHLANNYIDDPGVLVGAVNNPWDQPLAHPSFANLSKPESYYAATEIDFTQYVTGYHPITTHSALDAYDRVLEQAGAFPRDVVTRRMIDEVTARSGSWGVSSTADLMAGLSTENPPTDNDDDGMADDWEMANGLDPNDGDDHSTVMPSGYTAIEVYINSLADILMGGQPGIDPGGRTGDPPKGDDPGGDPGQVLGPPPRLPGYDSDEPQDGDTASSGSCASTPKRVVGWGYGALLSCLVGLGLTRRRRRTKA